MRSTELEKIREFAGDALEEQLRYVDCFLGEEIALFMPAGGPCFYALSPMHVHPAYLFVLPFNDQTSVRIDGRMVRAEHGRLFCLSPGVVHTELPSDDPPHYIAILVGKRFLDRQLALYSGGQGIVFRGESHVVHDDLLSLLKRFMLEADQASPGREAVLHGLSLQISHCVLRGIFGHSAAPDEVSPRIEINRVVQYLHANLERKIAIAHMADVACMAPAHFARLFKRETGRTPLAYLTWIRLVRVKKLLLAGDKTITDIAMDCGFGNSSYLSTCFRKAFKIAPSAFFRKYGLRKKSSASRKTGPPCRGIIGDQLSRGGRYDEQTRSPGVPRRKPRIPPGHHRS